MDGIVATKGGRVIAREQGRGIGPALALFHAGKLVGAEVSDRIVGRAAAAVFVLGGAAQVRADVMSEGAARFLSAHGIPCGADLTVPQIINRKGTGPCPMEQAVEGLDDPQTMVAAVERTWERLNG